MKAMILAAGKGTRVRPITHTIPKPMIPILQKPVMEFLLELLKEHGFTEVMVNVSHLAEEIENYFRDGQRFGVEIAYSFEGRIEDGELIGDALGSAGGLKNIQNSEVWVRLACYSTTNMHDFGAQNRKTLIVCSFILACLCM